MRPSASSVAVPGSGTLISVATLNVDVPVTIAPVSSRKSSVATITGLITNVPGLKVSLMNVMVPTTKLMPPAAGANASAEKSRS